jgi:hypothetical protein
LFAEGIILIKSRKQMKILEVPALFLFFSWVMPLWAVTPMEYYNSLVAGDDEAGFQDGAFDDARFNQPGGLAMDEEGKRLFVADKNNNRIRVVYLEENNRVETLAGNGDDKNLDGSLNQASFSGPCLLALLPDDQLAVYDSRDGSVRRIDLKNKSVTTLTEGLRDVWNMAYFPLDQGLYFSMPNRGFLQRVDLKNKTLTQLLANDPQIPQPRALGVFSNKLYLSDGKTSVLYQVEPVFNSLNAAVTVHLDKAGSGENILELASSGENLYALQGGQNGLAKVLPGYQPVTLASAWGFTLKSASAYYSPIMFNSSDQQVGFAAMPGDQKKFFISPRCFGNNLIVSVKDYDFGARWTDRDAGDQASTDFEYPANKPPKTFRILIVGASRVVTAPAVPLDDSGNEIPYNLDQHDFHSPRTNTFPKQLEIFLNTEAALDDISEHFEVLTLAHPGLKIQFFAPDEVPVLVKKYDIDLVLGMVSPSLEDGYLDYYTKPLTPEGIPAHDGDNEYLLKPWRQRVPGGAPKRLLEEAIKLKLINEISPTELQFSLFQDLLLSGDNEIRDDLVEMLGKPFKVLNQRIGSLKTSSGTTPKLALFFVPAPDCESYSKYESFWSDICGRYGLTFLNLTKPYQDLEYSYFPTTEACCHFHYTAYGNELIATILRHELINQGWIPFTAEKK